MKPKKLYIVEQYVSWNGHYRRYFENLISEDYHYIYCSENIEKYPNSTYVAPTYVFEKTKSFVNFMKGRFFDSFRTYNILIDKHPDFAHLVEFEPFSFAYLLLTKSSKIPPLLITVHSIERLLYSNKIKDLISASQRALYAYTLRKAAKMGAKFTTHYQHHYNQLVALLGERYREAITLIPYPCPSLKVVKASNQDFNNKKLLIYGTIREDKGIFDFLSQPGTEKLNITIAGPVLDERILSFKNHNITFINKYFNEEDDDMRDLINSHSFMLLPYVKSYTGGSGTLKDSIAFGLPVIASDIPTFREVIQEGQVGYIFKTVGDIISFSDNITAMEYTNMAQNCLKYAQKYNWENMRREYFRLYEESLILQK